MVAGDFQANSGLLRLETRHGNQFFVALNIDFAALMAATKFHFDGPETLSLDSARTRRALDPLFDATWEAPFLTHETGRGRPVFGGYAGRSES